MQISCVIEGYYHNALYLVYYSYSNGQVWAENISRPSAVIADWELENGDHWFKLHMWRGRMRACLLSPSRSSCNLNIKLSSSIFDVSTIAVKRRIWDPLVLCYKNGYSNMPQSPMNYLWMYGANRWVIWMMRLCKNSHYLHLSWENNAALSQKASFSAEDIVVLHLAGSEESLLSLFASVERKTPNQSAQFTQHLAVQRLPTAWIKEPLPFNFSTIVTSFLAPAAFSDH